MRENRKQAVFGLVFGIAILLLSITSWSGSSGPVPATPARATPVPATPAPRAPTPAAVPVIPVPATPARATLVPATPDFNYLLSPQFRMTAFSGLASLKNGGLGDGANYSYFCGPTDELNSYRSIMGGARLDAGPNSTMSQAEYKIVQIEDRCRTEGCGGGIATDGKCSLIAIPIHATNCYPWKGGAVFDALVYQLDPSESAGASSPNSLLHPWWHRRNYVDDGYGFVFGRYLVQRVACAGRDNSALEVGSRLSTVIAESDSDTEQLDNDYDAFKITPNFVDLPYSYHHLVSGFACPQVFNAGGYKTNRDFGRSTLVSGQEYRMGAKWGRLHKDLMKLAADRLARSIARGEYGNMYPGPGGTGNKMSVKDKETRAVVVNAWNILNWAKDNIDWEPCSGFSCGVGRTVRVLSGNQPVELYSCRSISGNNLVEYVHDKSRLCVKSLVARDCQSQRTVGSDPHYNVTGGAPDDRGRCTPSYGTWRDGGLYERSFQTSAGYEVFEEGGDIRAREDGYVSVAGYAPFITAQLAHQTCHAFLKKTQDIDRIATWPSNGALWEEGLCVMTEALVYTNLCKLGYCSHNFKMEEKDFVREVVLARPNDLNSTVNDTVRGERFSYPNYCRGYAGAFLGPYCSTMMNIAQTIQHVSVEVAQTMAIMKAMAPTLAHPEQMYINGQESEFQLPEPARRQGLFSPTDISAGGITVDGAARTSPALQPQPQLQTQPNTNQKAQDTKNIKGTSK